MLADRSFVGRCELVEKFAWDVQLPGGWTSVPCHFSRSITLEGLLLVF
ncbi:MAG: hypothetical protein QXK94_08225 [Candidatus Jordarchaeales archaeon]